MKLKFKKITALLTLSLSFSLYANVNLEKNNHNLSVLFVQHAKQVNVKPLKNDCYQLSLMGERKKLLYFSDRPNRVVGHMSKKQFLKIWNNNKIDPNVLVDGFVSPHDALETTSNVLTFQSIHYNEKTGATSYVACLTDPHKQRLLTQKKLFDVTLFFDNFDMWESAAT